jgi:AcrR family transcriptional regulator
MYTRVNFVAGQRVLWYVCGMEQIVSDSGWRGSPEVWLEAAFEALLESGIDAVKIQPLAKRINLSRTSFYWFFKDREELLAGLLARWRNGNTGNLIRRTEAYADTVAEAMLNVFDCWLDRGLFDPQFEFAIRSWALQSDDILHEVRVADRLRMEALTAMLVRYGQPVEVADVHARTTYLVQIGYISMQTREGLEERMKRIPTYVETFCGQRPSQKELDRFFAKHGYSPDRTDTP